MAIKDGDWTLFDWSPELRRSVWVMYDSFGNVQHMRTDYDVEGVISDNAQVRKVAQKAWTGDYHRVASIPLNVAFDEKTGLMEAHNNGDDKYLSRWLNDSDNRAWRTKEGNV